MGNDISKGTGRATGRVVDGRAGWDADRKADGSAAGRGRRAVHNAFRDIGTGRYHFKLDDRIAAEMVKAYLRTMEVQEAICVLQGIVDPRVIQLDFSRGHTGCQKALWTDVNGIRLAELIDRAKGIMAEENRDWIAEDRIQKKTQQYLEEGFRELSGEKFVSSMPVEFAEFITDCYLCLKHN